MINKLAEIVKFHRKKSKLSRVELAKLAGVGKTVVYDLEHSKMSIQLNTLIKIFLVLNIEITLDSPIMEQYYETLNTNHSKDKD